MPARLPKRSHLCFCASLRAASPTKVILKHSSSRCREEILTRRENNVAGVEMLGKMSIKKGFNNFFRHISDG